MKDFKLLPNDEETAKWFDENIDYDGHLIDRTSASSAIYKFRLWLKERQDLKTAYDKANKTSKEFGKPEPQPEYEYELLFTSEFLDSDVKIKIDGWYPIETSRLRHPELIEQYIKAGTLRRIKYAIFRCTASGNGGWDISKEIFFKEPSTNKADLEKVCEEENKNKTDQWHYFSVYEINDGMKALMRGEIIS